MTWKGQPLSFYTGLYDRADSKSPLMMSTRYTLCKMALFELGLSEREFYDKYDDLERAQLIATYQTHQEIQWVQVEFPLKTGKG